MKPEGMTLKQGVSVIHLEGSCKGTVATENPPLHHRQEESGVANLSQSSDPSQQQF